MGLKPLREFLSRHRRIALDTSIFIYELQATPAYLDAAHEIFTWVERPGHVAVTSAITFTELLVQPYRAGDEPRIDAFYSLLTTYPNLTWIPADLNIADIAAKIRAAYRLRTPDALQAASAVQAQATGLITNDPAFRRIDMFETFALDDGITR